MRELQFEIAGPDGSMTCLCSGDITTDARRELLHRASLEADGLLCRQISLQHVVRGHEHESYLISFVLAGSGLHDDDRGRLPILNGDVCILRPGQWHAYPRVHGTLSLCTVAVTHSFLLACLPLLGDLPWLDTTIARAKEPAETIPPAHMRLSPFELDRFLPLLLALEVELEDPLSDTRPGVRAGLLLQILGLLATSDSSRHRAMHTNPDGDLQDDHGLQTAIRYLEERYMGSLTVEELALQTGYTPTYLTRKFRQRLGMSPSEYLLNLRVHHASTLLHDTNLSISAVAAHVGFHDSHHFAKRFHQVMGMTPSAFRTQSRTDEEIPGH